MNAFSVINCICYCNLPFGLSALKLICWFCQGFQPPVLIFVQSKDRAKDLFHELFYDKANVEVIHGDKTQAQVSGIADWDFRKHFGSKDFFKYRFKFKCKWFSEVLCDVLVQ